MTQVSIDEIHLRSIGCSAKAGKIDQEWEKRVEESDEVYIWRAFEKTKWKNIKYKKKSSELPRQAQLQRGLRQNQVLNEPQSQENH